MTLAPDEFIRRFLLHVLPNGFHRIRHYGLLASALRAANIARARELIAAVQDPPSTTTPTAAGVAETIRPPPCPCCGGRMIIVETFERGGAPRDRHRRAGSGSTPHDHRHASRLHRRSPLPSSRAPEHKSDVRA